MEIDIRNKVKDIVRQLWRLVPAVFDGGLLNAARLNALLAEQDTDTNEMYSFVWPGKNKALKTALTPATSTLQLLADKSVNANNTKNIVIIGDNLEALKLLAAEYTNKIKTIYIDPPYNNCNELTYNDSYICSNDQLPAELLASPEYHSGQLEAAIELSRRHSAWLTMIYPRLYLARMLLRDDGVIFVSIDDNEVHRLRMIMDEIFGERNFICQFIWKCRSGPSNNVRFVSIDTEYILLYSKDADKCKLNEIILDMDKLGYNLEDEYVDQRGRYQLRKLDFKDRRYNFRCDFPIEHNGLVAIPGGTKEENDKKIWAWRWNKEKVKWGLENDYIVLKKDTNGIVRAYFKIYEKVDNKGNIIQRRAKYRNVIEDIYSLYGTNDIVQIFNDRVISYPKPVELIKYLLAMSTCDDDIVLDFFAGSGTTGQAVWELNNVDNGNRTFILVQLDEPVNDKRIAKKFSTIADICIERLRRVSPWYNSSLLDIDTGFKVFRIEEAAKG